MIASITLAECAIAGTYNLSGALRGLYSNASSRIEFSAETYGGEFLIGGQKATPVGSIGLETTAGGYLMALAPPHWFACTEQGGGKYKDGKCASEGAPNEWESVLLEAGTKTTIAAKGNPLAVTATIGGLKGTINCETEVTNASLENPSGGGNGTGNAELKLKGCKAEGGWSTCKVTPGAAIAEKLELLTLEGKSYARITPKEGTAIASFTLAECAVAGTYNLTGALRGLYSNANSRIEFSAETYGGEFLIGGNKATPVGSIGLETAAGGYIRAG